MPRGSISRVRQVWCERLRRFQNATTTVGRFCQTERVSTASSYAWRKRLAHQFDGAAAEAAFFAVRMPVMQAEVCVPLPGGATFELCDGLSRERLLQVIAATILATRGHDAGDSNVCIANHQEASRDARGRRRQAC